MTPTGEAILAGLGDLYSKDDSTLHAATCEALGFVIDSMFTAQTIADDVRLSIVARAHNGFLGVFAGDTYSAGLSNSEHDETRMPWASPQVLLGELASEAWCSGSHQLIANSDTYLRRTICDHVSPWTDVQWDSSPAFILGTTELL